MRNLLIGMDATVANAVTPSRMVYAILLGVSACAVAMVSAVEELAITLTSTELDCDIAGMGAKWAR